MERANIPTGNQVQKKGMFLGALAYFSFNRPSELSDTTPSTTYQVTMLKPHGKAKNTVEIQVVGMAMLSQP
jgi:hypothetical protein